MIPFLFFTPSQISKLDPATVGYGLLVLVVGLSVRVVVSFFSVLGGGLTTKERLFVALAWLPKATVQAAIGGVAFDAATKMDPENVNREMLNNPFLISICVSVLQLIKLISNQKLASEPDFCILVFVGP